MQKMGVYKASCEVGEWDKQQPHEKSWSAEI